MLKVLFLVNIPAPYRIDFFNELAKKCELTVLIEGNKASHRNDEWLNRSSIGFNAKYLTPRKYGKVYVCTDVKKYLTRDYDIIVIGVYNTPTSILAMHYMKSHSIPFVISVDGGYIKNENALHKAFKTHLIGMAGAWLSPSRASDDYLKYYGAREEGIYRYPFTSLSQDDMSEAGGLQDKQLLRSGLNIAEEKVVLSVGRFSYQNGYGKGYDTLMKAAEELPDIGFYIVGDEPTEEFLNWKESKKLGNVHFIGFQTKDEIKKYYGSADVFVLLTRGDVWGLVINEAMNYSLPVITTDKCVAGVELVENGVNGFLVSADDYTQTVESLKKIFASDISEYGKNSRKTIQPYTIEKMAEKHIEIFGEIVNGRD